MTTLRERMRVVAGIAMVLLAMVLSADSRADAHVPPQLQAQLVGRLGSFDRNFQARAGAAALVLVVHKAGDAESSFEAASLAKALGELHDVGGLPPKVEEAEFGDVAQLAARCRARHVAIVYFAGGLENEMGRVAGAFSGVDVLTVGTSARHAENGAVVGFGLEEARPKLVLNLRQARVQNVNFKAEVLKLARLVE